jgi:uncharacterized protein Yka (UPF0111/DUF47 family)
VDRRHGEDQFARIERTLEVIERILPELQEEIKCLRWRVERLERNQDTHRKYARTTALIVNAH